MKSDFGNLIKFLEKRADANTLIVYTYVRNYLLVFHGGFLACFHSTAAEVMRQIVDLRVLWVL